MKNTVASNHEKQDRIIIIISYYIQRKQNITNINNNLTFRAYMVLFQLTDTYTFYSLTL